MPMTASSAGVSAYIRGGAKFGSMPGTAGLPGVALRVVDGTTIEVAVGGVGTAIILGVQLANRLGNGTLRLVIGPLNPEKFEAVFWPASKGPHACNVADGRVLTRAQKAVVREHFVPLVSESRAVVDLLQAASEVGRG